MTVASGAPPVPRALGVDDFAWRRGRRYSTALVDLERLRVVDVPLDRSAATFAARLRAHPGMQTISRDRGGPCADRRAGRRPAQTHVDEPNRGPQLTRLPPSE